VGAYAKPGYRTSLGQRIHEFTQSGALRTKKCHAFRWMVSNKRLQTALVNTPGKAPILFRKRTDFLSLQNYSINLFLLAWFFIKYYCPPPSFLFNLILFLIKNLNILQGYPLK
jgi:hypothetical protein